MTARAKILGTDSVVEARVWCLTDDGDCARYVDIEFSVFEYEPVRRALYRHGWLLLETGEALCGPCWGGWFATRGFDEYLLAEISVRQGMTRREAIQLWTTERLLRR